MRKGWIACVLVVLAAPGTGRASPTSPPCKVSDTVDCEIVLTVTTSGGGCVVNVPATVFVEVDQTPPKRRRQVSWVLSAPSAYQFDARFDPPVRLKSNITNEVARTWYPGALSSGLQKFTWVLRTPAREHLVVNKEITYDVKVVGPGGACTSQDPVIGNGRN